MRTKAGADKPTPPVRQKTEEEEQDPIERTPNERDPILLDDFANKPLGRDRWPQVSCPEDCGFSLEDR